MAAKPHDTRGGRPGEAARNDAAGRDPGSFIGHEPERATETIPGGLSRKDQRVSAVATQPGAASPEDQVPNGHRDGGTAGGDSRREAGQNR